MTAPTLLNVAPGSLSCCSFALGSSVIHAGFLVGTRTSRPSDEHQSSSRSYFVGVVASSNGSCRESEKKSTSVAGVFARKDNEFVQSRRSAALCLLGALGLSLLPCGAASASFSPGFPGVKDWLKGQKQKTAKFLLAPISASRDRLASALLLISAEYVSSGSYEEAENLVKVAARDCMPLETGSVLDFQSRSGIEVCTFKLVLKNAASLLDNADPVKLQAEQSLMDLIRSFVTLDEILATGATGGFPDRKNLEGALSKTSLALDRFEGGVRACLGIV